MDLDPKYDDYDFPYEAATPQDGHPGHLTEAQIAQVHQFRMLLEAEGFTDRLDTLTLVRFLPSAWSLLAVRLVVGQYHHSTRGADGNRLFLLTSM